MNLLPSRVPLPLDTVVHSDALTFLRGLPDNTVNCVVTSPPYFGLRDYGVAGQIGLEDTPAAFVAKMVELFREVRRVLRDDGTCWVNLGDSYATNVHTGEWGLSANHKEKRAQPYSRIFEGLPAKNLLMIPARVAIALQDDGWILRSEIVWAKKNPLPESVTDRCTKSHEMVYMLAKNERYWYDADAIREPQSDATLERSKYPRGRSQNGGGSAESMAGWHRNDELGNMTHNPAGRNRRSVWTIATEPSNWDYCSACGRFYEGTQRNLIHVHDDKRYCVCGRCDAWVGHFAAYPEALIEPCILSGCPHKVCTACGAPWVRQVEREGGNWEARKESGAPMRYGMNNNKGHVITNYGGSISHTLGFAPACSHDAPTRPGIVLDPFMGSGTTGLVARRLGRHYMGSELNAEYVALCRERLAVPFTMPMFEMLEVPA